MNYRLEYENHEHGYMGCADIEADTEQEAINRFWLREPDCQVYYVKAHPLQTCAACGQTLINLGLIYDECPNRECTLWQEPQPAKEQSK